MLNAHQLSRACRTPGYRAPGPSDPDPPAFMAVPTTCARAAVRMLHTADPAAARLYLGSSKVGQWTGHSNASMASGAQAVVAGFDWYARTDAADGRPMTALDRRTVVTLAGNTISARLDVVLDDGEDLAGRVILWDGPDFHVDSAPTIACAFAHAMVAAYPGRNVTTIGVWQARRQRAVEVPHADAIAATTAASAVLAAM